MIVPSLIVIFAISVGELEYLKHFLVNMLKRSPLGVLDKGHSKNASVVLEYRLTICYEASCYGMLTNFLFWNDFSFIEKLEK